MEGERYGSLLGDDHKAGVGKHHLRESAEWKRVHSSDSCVEHKGKYEVCVGGDQHYDQCVDSCDRPGD